jgi:hypothetical protein
LAGHTWRPRKGAHRMNMARPGRVNTGMALAAAVLVAAACYPDEITDVDEFDTVTTIRNDSTNFNTALRYAIADSVVHFPIEDTTISHVGDDALIARIRSNMHAAGYVEVPNSEVAPPDFYVALAISTDQYVVISGGCGWWGWYAWWGGCGWGWYYPTYPYAYSYEIGTLFVMLLDRRRADEDAMRMPMAWIAAVNGVISGDELDRALAGIDQAFEQSPYLSGN